MNEIKISVVSYLNSAPFIYGLKNASFPIKVLVEEDIPAVCAQKLIEGKVDIGLIPVAVLPFITPHYIISDYCIGADGPVASVMLYSEVPLEKTEQILLDYQSRTSVMLTRLLARDYWKISPKWVNAQDGYESQIKGTTAAVVIGDRTFKLQNKYPFAYDLAHEWKKHTGMPFVFACWVANKPISEEFMVAFNMAIMNGVRQLPEVIRQLNERPDVPTTIYQYLTKNISYHLDMPKKQALSLFLERIKSII